MSLDSLPIDSVVALDDCDLREILYFPPLLHAVSTHSWAYVFWLIGSCASLREKVTVKFDVLCAITATRSLETIGFFFKECWNREGGAALLPSQFGKLAAISSSIFSMIAVILES